MKIEYKKGQFNYIADMLSRDPGHKFNLSELDLFNHTILLPESLFQISDTSSLSDQIIAAQHNDSFCIEMVKKIKKASRKKRVENFSLKDSALFHKNRLWVPTKELRDLVFNYHHDHCLAGHPGINGTVKLITRDYYWRGLKKSVHSKIITCISCNRNKPSLSKPAGLLKPLEIPSGPWSSLSVDFITDLPSSNGYDSIMVVVDRFTNSTYQLEDLDVFMHGARVNGSRLTKYVSRLRNVVCDDKENYMHDFLP